MGLAREAGAAVDGTGFAGVRGQARSHPNGVASKASAAPVGATALRNFYKSTHYVGAGLPREHRRSRCHAPRSPIRGTSPLPPELCSLQV